MTWNKTDEMKWTRMGRYFALGALEVIAFVTFVGYLIIGAASWMGIPRVDDCDVNAFHRCGLRVLTDNRTGTQYLVTEGGGIVERKKP